MKEIRLIDADALKESIDEHVYLVTHGFNETEYGCTQYGIHQIIDETPTIDAEPVRHGKWIEVEDSSIRCICSACGWESNLYEDDVYGMPYCPNCGARMDKDD